MAQRQYSTYIIVGIFIFTVLLSVSCWKLVYCNHKIENYTNLPKGPYQPKCKNCKYDYVGIQKKHTLTCTCGVNYTQPGGGTSRVDRSSTISWKSGKCKSIDIDRDGYLTCG